MRHQLKSPYFLAVIFITFFACKSTKAPMEMPEVVIDEELLDTMVVTASPIVEEEEVVYELPGYQASATRKHDLLHTKLEIAFDWAKQHVLGKATLQLKPMFYATNTLELDAKVFDIHKIEMNGKSLTYDYDEQKLKINLDRTYTRYETYTVYIEYTAKPNEGPSGGSAAITSDKGLFFINPLKENKNKPQQIWTQGETENSSRWFPTIDKPNERCSQEIYVTVQEKFQTLSNGKLISSTSNPNGTRTDYWKQEKPHAPYLFMLGVGEYAVVKDTWNGKDLMYYVEKEYEDDAEKIFNHTPEMLEFFSDILGYSYPWDKYAQIVCRDYVSGAMENTGAVVFGEFVQKNSRELIDSNNDDIVAHELFHHWFGDLVTCESWSNLTLNEGFATYSEFLWREYKYGHENAERKRLQDMNGYLMSAQQGGTHDLIDFEYGDKEQMFDGHSYNKGGLVVHMLRSYVGDDAFFSGLKFYLEKHQYSDVEAHELRLAFEDVVGEDLNWFFNQWFFDEGHPILAIDNNIDAESKSVMFSVVQTQDPEEFLPIFQFPVEVAMYYPSGKVEYVEKWINQREQEFTIDIEGDEMPVVAVLDGKHDILAIIKESRTEQEYVDLFNLSNEFGDKNQALKNLKGTPSFSKILDKAINDDAKEIRSMVVSSLDPQEYKDKLINLVLNDESSAIRAMALKSVKDIETAKKVIKNEQSFRVIGEALNVIYKNDKDLALKEVNRLTKSYHKPLISKIAEIYANTGDEKYLGFFEKNINSVSLFGFFNYMKQYEKLIKSVEDVAKIVEVSNVLKKIALDQSNNYFKKYSSTNTIQKLISNVESRKKVGEENKEETDAINKLTEIMKEIVNTSTDERLRSSFQEYIQP
ncbi:MAG: M1 family metallopeptidase [Saprospiraceae bacterium]|nr:M1 family metallopeptidase [Saprospiraceae bacterium]